MIFGTGEEMAKNIEDGGLERKSTTWCDFREVKVCQNCTQVILLNFAGL